MARKRGPGGATHESDGINWRTFGARWISGLVSFAGRRGAHEGLTGRTDRPREYTCIELHGYLLGAVPAGYRKEPPVERYIGVELDTVYSPAVQLVR